MCFEHWVYTVPLRLRSLFRRKHVEQELQDELRDHLEQQIKENVARGMTAEEARSQPCTPSAVSHRSNSGAGRHAG